MLSTIQIPVGVSTQDCLSWSSDGELAIAAGEEVYLLLPSSKDHEPWTHVRFRVNTFTYDEWPVRPQASFAEMSIGEEQARVTIASLRWSPPGLAKNRRSVLAILTTNLILSLWAPGSDPKDPEGWKRTLIVNNTAISPSNAPHSTVHSLERVRSVTWLPLNGQHRDPGSPFSTRKWGIPLLAVADDNNGLCILTVYSPFTSAFLSWGVQVLAYKTLPDYQRSSRPSLLSEALNRKNFIDNISFADWNSAGELLVTCLSSGTFHQIKLNVFLEPSMGATMTDGQVNQAAVDQHYGLPRQAPNFMHVSMKGHKTKYSSDNHLDLDDVVMKVWGFDHSECLGAVCVTCHPARMVEYQAPAADSATILFGNVDSQDASQSHEVSPCQSITQIDHAIARQTIITTIIKPLITSQTGDQPLKLTRFDLKIIYAAVIAQLVLDVNFRQQSSGINDVEAALVIMEDRSGIQLQLERTLITSFQRSSKDLGTLLNEWAHERSENGFGQMAPGVQLLDNCPFCGNRYLGLAGGFEGFTEANCPKNHPFARCALTFLPILEPGCSKYCSKCKREFINEELQPEISPFQRAQTPDSKPSLANLLFAKFDTCPYCGGKYCE